MSAVVENLPIREKNENPHRIVMEKYALSVIRPFDLMATLYILSKYKIREGFITPNTFFYNVVSGVWSFTFIIAFFLSLFRSFFITGLDGYNFVKLYTNIHVFVLYLVGNATCYCNNVMQRYNNVELALRIQNICEIFEVNGDSLKRYSLLNWVYLLALIIFQVAWIASYSIGFSSVVSMDEAITNLFYLIFDTNMLYVGRVIELLLQPLKTWVDDVRKSDYIADSENELYWNRKFRVYMEIVEAYEIVGKNYRMVIPYYCTGTFINGVLSILIRIELAKAVDLSFVKIAISSISLLWMVKNISLITSLCLKCEAFYTLLLEVRSTCVQLTTSDCCSGMLIRPTMSVTYYGSLIGAVIILFTESQKRVCKNIQRIQAASIKKMTACGLFAIDAALPMKFFGLLTTYIIVVLQFEFL